MQKVRYLPTRSVLAGMAPGDWGFGLIVDSRSIDLMVGPFFLFWAFR